MSWVRRFVQAESLDRGVELLADPGLRLLGGGSRLVPGRPVGVDGLVHLDLSEMSGISRLDRALWIGSRTTLSRLVELEQFDGLLGSAAISLGHSPNLRNQMTVGGECAWRSTGSQLQVALLVLEAVVLRHGLVPTPMADYLAEVPRQGIITALEIPLHQGWRFRFDTVAAAKGAAPRITMAASARLERGKIAEARLAFGDLGHLPQRVPTLEKTIVGTPTGELLLTDADTAGIEIVTGPAGDIPPDSTVGMDVKLAWVKTLANRFLMDLIQEVGR